MLSGKHEDDMATWVECQTYTPDRTKIWINLDHVISIKGFENGCVLTFAVADQEGALERTVWDKPTDILAKAKR
jgi:hypothetical protein